MHRRQFLKKSALGAAALTLPGCGKLSMLLLGGGKEQRPNVLFIAVDDLRPQLGCYGHRQMLSPNIDGLASEGVVFGRNYCQVPVCGASRASILTGVRPTRTRFWEWDSRADQELPGVVTVQRHFRDNGYYCVSNGKVAHHADDYGDDWSEQPWRAQLNVAENYVLEDNRILAAQRAGRAAPYEAADVPDNAYPDGRIADKTIEDLRRLTQMKSPFFLAAGFLKPHLPFNCPKEYWHLYKREAIDLADNPFRPKGAPDVALHNWGELRAYAGIPAEGPLSDETARTLIHGYYACVSSTDAQIGRLLHTLDELGIRDNTVVVLWGDHGWNLGEHGLWCKHCNFETSLHSLLIISAPRLTGGKRTDALTEFVDIYPSLCDLAGLPIPSHLEGRSLMPLMENPDRPWNEAVFSRFKNGESMKTDRYRYTEWTDDNSRVYAKMLYDHKKDPWENVNISELLENAAMVSDLQRKLHAHISARDAHLPSPPTRLRPK